MTAAKGIDIVTFHQQQVVSDEVEWDGSSVKWVVVVSVDSTEPDGLSIYADQSILELNDPESHFLKYRLSGRVCSEGHLDVVEVRDLGGPFQWGRDGNC